MKFQNIVLSLVMVVAMGSSFLAEAACCGRSSSCNTCNTCNTCTTNTCSTGSCCR